MNRTRRGAAVVAGLASIVASWVAWRHHELAWVPPALVVCFLVGYLLVYAREQNEAVVEVGASRRGLTLGGALVPARELVTGVVGRSPVDAEGTIVILRERRGAWTSIVLESSADARALLDALGLGGPRSSAWFRATFAGGWATLGLFAGCALLAVLLGPVALACGAVALVLDYVTRRTEIEVAPDGVRLHGLVGARFLPFSALGGVEVVATGAPAVTERIRLLPRTGSPITLTIPISPNAPPRLAEVCARRIRRGIERATRTTDEALLASLDRGARPARAWIEHLRAIGTGAAASLRRAHVPVDRLARLVEDPLAPPVARVAAAIAAGASSDADLTRRLQASTSASEPKLRVAIEVALDREREAELEALLAELEDEERAREHA